MSQAAAKKNRQPILALDPVALAELKKKEAEYIAQENADAAAAGKGQTTSRDTVLNMILDSLKKNESSQIQRMAFEVDPVRNQNAWGSLYRMKSGLTPDHIIKRITGPQGDELVCQILQARANHAASFGRPRSSRFAVGFEFEEISDNNIAEGAEAYEEEKRKLSGLKEILWNCGYKGLDDEYFHPNLSQFMKMVTRDGLAYGRFAVEFIWVKDKQTGKEKCHAFRAVDAGTIYRIVPKKENDQRIRAEALRMLAELKNEKIEKDRYEKDEYRWVQVIEGQPRQAFTDKELVVYNMYPVTNVEYNGYPLTPIDQALNAITTHINITMHNKLYFQHGRAARGMLVFQSDDLDEGSVQKIRLQFHQSINSVQNSWRMPVFGVGQQDKLTWQSIDVSGRDAEFQYLSDNNARVILSSFQMSPEELPGYAHLARGTNSQALSESDNEWKLTAARDVGLRPMLYDLQDFFNTHVIPKFDEVMSKKYQMILAGLEKDSPEKEATRLTQDMPIHMTMNEVLEQVEKEKLPKELGGDLILNPQFHQLVIQPYFTVGQIMENFMATKGAASDPRFNYVRDPFWMQNQQLLLQKAQLAMQTQMAQQQAQAAEQQQAMGGGNEAPPADNSAPPGASKEEKDKVASENAEKNEKWLAQNYMLLNKSINDNQDMISKMLLKRHREIVGRTMDRFKTESEQALDKIVAATKGKKE